MRPGKHLSHLAVILSGLILCRSCVGNRSCCESMSLMVMSDLEGSIHFTALLSSSEDYTFCLLLCFFPWTLLGEGTDTDVSFRAEHSIRPLNLWKCYFKHNCIESCTSILLIFQSSHIHPPPCSLPRGKKKDKIKQKTLWIPAGNDLLLYQPKHSVHVPFHSSIFPVSPSHSHHSSLGDCGVSCSIPNQPTQLFLSMFIAMNS